MTVTALMPVRNLNLVAPLPHQGTDMHTTDTAATARVWSGAASTLIGIDFVGHLIKPWHRITRRKTVRVALNRLRSMPAEDLHQSGNSYFGQVRQASHSHADQVKLARLLRKRGHAVKGDLTKIYRRKAA